MKTLLFILIFSVSYFAQTPEKCACSKQDELEVREYLEQIPAQNEFINECNQKFLESLPDNVKILPKTISHLSPTAISLVKPYYPKFAREYKISGQVLVEIIFDEKGLVIYAKAFKGHRLLRKYAEEAACASKFTPVLYCDKPTKQRRVIRYNFVL